MHPSLTVRVYGFLMDESKGLLVSDELIQGKNYTKLPGGGLEYGEGTKECLRREFLEETGVEVIVGDHIYTTDYFQPSAFKEHQQFMGIYYFVHTDNTDDFKTHDSAFDFTDEQRLNHEAESLRWIAIADLKANIFPLPTDKIALEMVLKQMRKKSIL